MAEAEPSGWFARVRSRLHETDSASTFGPYLIEGELGRGGCGVVYRARHMELDRPVALKLMRAATEGDAKRTERFHREALAIAKLRHPNIVLVHDAGKIGDVPYIAMELVEGETLGSRLRRREPELRELAAILAKVADAAHCAHQQGIVHRDLKPDNVLLDAAQEPRLVDFGMAHVAESTASLTRTGAILGTPLYMAPEQVRGESGRIGPRTDVYALGVILYEILARRPPFAADTAPALYRQILAEDPAPPRRVNPEIPAALETVCLKAMAKEIDRRYEDAAALAADLRAWLAGEPVSARPPSTLYRVRKFLGRRRALSAALFASALTALAVFVVVSRPRAREPRILLRDDFETHALSDAWAARQNYGHWYVGFTGRGTMGIVQDGPTRAHFQNPDPSMGTRRLAQVTTRSLAGDLEIRLRFKVAPSPQDMPGGRDGAWIWWHYQSEGGALRGYAFTLSRDGWVIWKKHRAAGQSLFDEVVLAGGSDVTLQLDRWYELRLAQRGGSIEARLDGALLGACRDDGSRWGLYREGALALNAHEVHALFDDVEVRELEPAR